MFFFAHLYDTFTRFKEDGGEQSRHTGERSRKWPIVYLRNNQLTTPPVAWTLSTRQICTFAGPALNTLQLTIVYTHLAACRPRRGVFFTITLACIFGRKLMRVEANCSVMVRGARWGGGGWK